MGKLDGRVAIVTGGAQGIGRAIVDKLAEEGATVVIGDIDGDKAVVSREVDGGMQTVKVKMPTVITVDLRLNEPRYASLPNIMKAKKKPLDEKTAADYGVDVTPRLEILKTVEPEARAAGIKVGSVDELVSKLKEAGAV